MRVWQVAVLSVCLGFRVLSAQAPSGYHLGANIVLPDSLLEVSAGGRFRMTVHRQPRTAREREFLTRAEQLYPAPESLLAVARDAKHRDHLLALSAGVVLNEFRVVPRAAGIPADRWWLDTFDATWLPYAVTSGAVSYYMERLRDLAAGRNQFAFGPGDDPDKGSFDYTATVQPTTEFGATHVVELSIRWNYWCGFLCAMAFVHSRKVWFDAKGAVIRITGDGRPEVIVS